jgi:serine protease Do
MAKMKRSTSSSASVSLALAVALAVPATAQQSLETNFRTTGDAVLAVFEPQRMVIQKSSAVIYDGRKEIAYGTVITAEGHILTKASEAEGVSKIDVRIDKESYKDAKVLMTDPRWDLALLKVEATGLTPVVFAPDSKLPRGTWVVVNGVTSRTNRRVMAGIISADAREIPPEGGAVLGVTLKETKKGLAVEEVSKDSGAEKAGMKKGDILTDIAGKPVKEIAALGKLLGEMKSGTDVKVTLLRDGKKTELDVKLSARGDLFREVSRNDQMSGDFSNRRSGFPRVIQHDILGASITMGGPVLDLEGRAVGMNIARANRAETFAIPVEELRELAEGMVKQAGK